jgi:hypothetical protein
MTELGAMFAELGISHYLNDFIEQGFDSWESILDITESDFDTLGVKLGHRRKLQRKIANAIGLSLNKALVRHTRDTPNHYGPVGDQMTSIAEVEGREIRTSRGLQGAKRRYRWHPKPDENAPESPPSAYVIFSNKIRGELKGRNLSFTEIAKLVGENWRSLSPGDKESYKRQAFCPKERYNAELLEYKKTSTYREYSQYRVEFKARQSGQQQVADCQLGRDTLAGRMLVDSSCLSRSQWPTHESHNSPAIILPVVQPDQPHPQLARTGDDWRGLVLDS